ncbi:putative membrane protein [Microbacterium sp. AG1240]|uniref:TMEM175 family protein n=1 Tax=Microbacterium sp. AG1240 TaxID=2183992 RepID=UPI000EB0AAB5|nr:TMEM175 family protein [Microbacterium sp. AG1240]RKT36216.1 putative membrane protein [Microbacterium sp. AG1240]
MFARRSHPDATQGTGRLEAFTDGVFAIAATLLVLDLTSNSIGSVSSDGDLLAGLRDMSGLFFNFVLSFVLLCLLWMTHTQQFEHVARVDGVVVWLNNARLLFIVLIPFVTGLTTEYSAFLVGRVVMPVTFFFAVVISWLQWMWARRHRERMLPDLSEAQAAAIGRAGLSAVIISVAVIALSTVAGSIAFVLFLLDPVVTRLLQRGLPRDSTAS